MTIAVILIWMLSVLLVLLGLIGLALPALPGAPLLFAGLLCAAWAEDFTYAGPWILVVLGAMAFSTYIVDFLASAFGAKRFGASRRAVVCASLGALAGLFFGLPGILLGPFVGAVVGELSAQRGLGQAGRSGVGATLGLALGVAAKLTLALAMIGVFLIVRFIWPSG